MCPFCTCPWARIRCPAALNYSHYSCTNENTLPALSGLLDTLSVEFKKTDLVSQISKQDKLCNKVFPLMYNEKVASFEESEINIVRSTAIYFTKGVMGKAKYKSVYKTLCTTKAEKKRQFAAKIKNSLL